jgi:hypothetical protein
MPFGLASFQEVTPLVSSITFTSADTTVAKAIVAAPGTPYRIDAIEVTSDDTAAVNLDIFLRVGATNFLLGSVTVPPGSGHAGVKAAEYFELSTLANVDGISLPGATSIQAACEATMTAAKTVVVTVIGGQF